VILIGNSVIIIGLGQMQEKKKRHRKADTYSRL